MSMPSSKDIYVMQHPLGPVKIGIATHPEDRLANLQVGCPFELKLRKSKTVPEPHAVEQYLHMYFRKYHMNGEWFDLPAEIRDFEIPQQISAGTPDVDMPVLDNVDFCDHWADSLDRAFRNFGQTRATPNEIRDIREQCRDLLETEEEQLDSTKPPGHLIDISKDSDGSKKHCSSCGHEFSRGKAGCPTCGSGSTFETGGRRY